MLGEDPHRPARRFAPRIGIVLQSSAVYHLLTVREILALFAGYYPTPRKPDEVIDRRATASRSTRVRTLSGGQLRGLDLALALIGDPEPSSSTSPTGFDPARETSVGDDPRARALGRNILLTTHYMEEAQRLADRLAILRDGEIVATGSPLPSWPVTPVSRSATARTDARSWWTRTSPPVC